MSRVEATGPTRARSGRAAAILYATASVLVAAFQVALAAGVPWGAYAMGGAYPGQFPPALRIAALVQAAIVLGMAAVVMFRAGLVLRRWHRHSRRLVWIAVAVAAASLVLNLITPSSAERVIWAPVALLLLVTSAVVATGADIGRPAISKGPLKTARPSPSPGRKLRTSELQGGPRHASSTPTDRPGRP